MEFLPKIAKSLLNDVNKCDFEEYRKGEYNNCNLPQNPTELHVLTLLYAYGPNKGSVKVTSNERGVTFEEDNEFVKVSLYTEDEPNYGDKGDLNSMDLSQGVYEALMKEVC